MVEPLFHSQIPDSLQPGQTFTLTGAEAKHAASVRRMRPGEAIQITNGTGSRLRGEVAQVEPQSVVVRIEQVVFDPAPSPRITLVQALAKGDRDELAIQAATELGVWAVIPWQADRSVSRWDGPKQTKGRERWQQIVTEAAKQSLRSWVPQVADSVTSKQLVGKFGEFDAVWVLEPTALDSLAKLAPNTPQTIALIIGPEGGIDPQELELFAGAGAKLVRLGDEVLRTSTAGIAAISVIQAGVGNWSAK